MNGLAGYMAARNLSFGLYTAQREFTCQDRPGSWRFEAKDIDTVRLRAPRCARPLRPLRRPLQPPTRPRAPKPIAI